MTPRSVLGASAAAVYGSPAEAFTLVGVTGTQGKTTTTQLLAHALGAAGRRTAVIGTLGTWIAGERVDTPLTTPEAPDLHAMFAVMREQGVEVCAMEVSSHALVLGRVDGVRLRRGGVLELRTRPPRLPRGRRGTTSPRRRVSSPPSARDVPCSTSTTRRSRLCGTRLEIPVRTFSPSGGPADWRSAEVTLRRRRLRLRPGRPRAASGRGCRRGCRGLQCRQRAGRAGLPSARRASTSLGRRGPGRRRAVTGRLEPVDEGQPFAVVVDYCPQAGCGDRCPRCHARGHHRPAVDRARCRR